MTLCATAVSASTVGELGSGGRTTVEEAANPDRKAVSGSSFLWGLLCFALCVQCTTIERATRVAVALDAEPSLRSRIAHVDLAFYSAIKTDAWRMRGQERLRTEGAGAWPLQWSFARTQPADKRYSLDARALDDDDKVIARLRAAGDFRDEGTVQLALRFDNSCKEACGEEYTCRDGACVDAEITPDMIVSGTGKADAGTAGRDAGDERSSATDTTLTSCSDAGGCISECGPDHGGCDPSVSCKLEQGIARCGMCPDGFEKQSDGSCSALLQALDVTGAALDPEFRPDQTAYTLRLGLIVGQWALTPLAATTAQLSVDGSLLPAGTPITSQLVAAGAEQLVVEVAGPQGRGRKYSFKLIAQGAELAFIKATTPTTDAHFGNRVALDGDTLVVSAESEDSSARGINPSNPPREGAANSGAVYVYKRVGSGWNLEAYIKASDSSAGANFGRSLALQGDTLVVGAHRDNDRGAAYVYERVGGTWTERMKLLPDEQNETNFGQSVALLDDVMVVAAPTYDAGANDSGVAFVYRRNPADGSWVFERKVVNQRPASFAWLGSGLALSHDYLVAGATGEANGSLASGTAYVFRADTFEQIDVLKPSSASTSAFFGERAAIAGDTIAVNSFNNNAGFDKGLVYIYTRTPEGEFEQATTLQASNATGGDQFGFSIALTEGYLLVGAIHESSGTSGINGSLSSPALENSGAAYLFARTGTGFNQIAHIKANEPAAGAQLGFDVAISGSDIVVSANADPRAATGSGAVYVFR